MHCYTFTISLGPIGACVSSSLMLPGLLVCPYTELCEVIMGDNTRVGEIEDGVQVGILYMPQSGVEVAVVEKMEKINS